MVHDCWQQPLISYDDASVKKRMNRDLDSVVREFETLLGAEDAVATVQFDAGHNYNRDSREAVYGWFARWLLGRPDASPVPEREFTAEQPVEGHVGLWCKGDTTAYFRNLEASDAFTAASTR